MYADVEVSEGGQLISNQKMKLKLIKEFSDNVVIYENDDGRAVMYFRDKDKYVLVSIDMA